MDLEYVATNRISVSSKEDIEKYLELCFWYFRSHIKNPECTPVPESALQPIVNGTQMIYKIWKESAPLENLNVVNYGHLGFAVQIIYEPKQSCFKLRIFADKMLREKNFDTTYEVFRRLLTSGPVGLGLSTIKEVEGNVDVPRQDFSFEDLERQQVNALNWWLKNYSEIANEELKEPDDYEEWLWGDLSTTQEIEEYNYEKKEKERAERRVRVIKSVADNLNKTSFVDKLRYHSSLFTEMRDDFAKRFNHKSDIITNTALGTLPWFHRNVMNGAYGTLLDEEGFIPNFRKGGFDDERANFMNAEIMVPPVEKDCKRIISLFPYTHIIPEFNNLHEEFLDDDDVMRAMLGHELAEAVIENRKVYKVGMFDILLNTPEMQMIEEEARKRTEVRHRIIDKMLVDIGLGPETKKMVALYRDRAKETLEERNKNASNYLNDPNFDASVFYTLKRWIKDLDEQLSVLSKLMSQTKISP